MRDREPDVVEWFASKDGKRLRILLGPEDVREGIIQAWRDAGYVISYEEWFRPVESEE